MLEFIPSLWAVECGFFIVICRENVMGIEDLGFLVDVSHVSRNSRNLMLQHA